VKVHRLVNSRGHSVSFISLGGVVTAIEMPDRHGRRENVVLAFADLAAYETQHIFLGCIVGRYANRIAGARFSLDGREFLLAATDGESCVHGGRSGFDKVVWRVSQDTPQSARLTHRSPDGDEGFPGNLDVAVSYALSDADEFRIEYEAVTDRPTVVNLTNHSYFNLAGEGSGDVLGHRLEVRASSYTPADSALIPSGDFAPVEGTPFDFRHPTAIGARIRMPHPQMIAGKGYDLNYVIERSKYAELAMAARLEDPRSGRVMEVLTTEPGLQLYTGNLLDGAVTGAGGRLYRQSDGVCLETHKYPDSPNKPSFPSPVLKPGEVYRSTTVYRFAAAE
jgi:aldose 1-epimerase